MKCVGNKVLIEYIQDCLGSGFNPSSIIQELRNLVLSLSSDLPVDLDEKTEVLRSRFIEISVDMMSDYWSPVALHQWVSDPKHVGEEAIFRKFYEACRSLKSGRWGSGTIVP